jgi:hypothetical protein
MAGGLLCVGWAAAMASRPPGVPGGLHRQTDDLAPVMLVSLLLIGAGLAGLRTRHAGRLGAWGGLAPLVGIAGAALMAVGLAIASQGDSPLVPVFLIPGFLAVGIGVLLSAVVALQAGVLPRWAVAPLLVGAFLFLLFNTEDGRAWLAAPFGAAWVLLGYVLWSGRGGASSGT